MADRRKQTPDFFEDDAFDPVGTATGHPIHSPRAASDGAPAAHEAAHKKKGDAGTALLPVKKKAGFYLSADMLERFNLKFYELKLAGVTIENKSNLLERLLAFALDDIDKGQQSRILKRIAEG
jgi:hypothetical protein